MSTSMMLDPSARLAPSELVLLNGEQFAKGSRNLMFVQGIKLLHVDAEVSLSQLGRVILATVFLAAEAAGNLRFEIRQDTTFFGLGEVENLYANPTPTSIVWPEYSLEAQLLQLAKQFKTKKQKSPKVYNLIHTWLQKRSISPWGKTIEMVKYGLVERRLLEKQEIKFLGMTTRIIYTLPRITARLAKDQPIEPIKKLLANWKFYERDIWDLLLKQIDQAIKARTYRSN